MENLGIIILAAGKGVRMGSMLPKVLIKLGERPLVDYVLRTAYSLHPARIVVVVGFGKDRVIDYITEHAVRYVVRTQPKNGSGEPPKPAIDLRFAVQEEQLGTGHAVLMTREMFANFHGNIVLLNGDVPLITTLTLTQLLENHEQNKAGATVLTAEYENPEGYGRILYDHEGNLLRIVEEKDASSKEKQVKEINTGVFVFHSDHLFRYINELQRDNTQSEYYITDMIAILRNHAITIAAWRSPSPEETYGINNPDQLKTLHDLLNSS